MTTPAGVRPWWANMDDYEDLAGLTAHARRVSVAWPDHVSTAAVIEAFRAAVVAADAIPTADWIRAMGSPDLPSIICTCSHSGDAFNCLDPVHRAGRS